jgi:hypothetical protein
VPRPASDHSTGTTLSAPDGTGAPVMIRMAVPGGMPYGADCPAADSPTTGRCTGRESRASATSWWRTAYPSMAEFSNRGSAIGDRTSSHSGSPTASSSGWSYGGSGVIESRMRPRCSSTERSAEGASGSREGSALMASP